MGKKREGLLKDFFSSIKWYGDPYIKGYLKSYESELRQTKNVNDWPSICYANTIHQSVLRNDYEFILAFVTYRFGDPGVYGWCVELYREEIDDNVDARNLLDIWFAFEAKFRMHIEYAFFSSLTQKQRTLLEEISKNTTSLSSSIAQQILNRVKTPSEFHELASDFIKKKNEGYLVDNSIANEILSDFAKSWKESDPELIIRHLGENFVYDSQWVFESLDYSGYVDYIRAKMKVIKETNAIPSVRIVRDPHSAIGVMLELKQNGGVGYYRIEVKDGKVVKGDMCMF